MTDQLPHGPTDLIERLASAVNRHDIDAIVDCFTPDYRNETPVHPARGFSGRDQVRKNWEQILTLVPDIRAEVLSAVREGDTIFSEWEHRGTRGDGTLHLMRGVIIFGLAGSRAGWARFYLEPVQEGAQHVDAFILAQAGTGVPA